MANANSKLTYLFNRYKDGSATGAEKKALLDLVQQPGMEEAVKDLIGKETEGVDAGVYAINVEQSRERADEMLRKILAANEIDITVEEPAPPKIGWRRWVAAAIITGLVAGAAWFAWNASNEQPGKNIMAQEQRFQNDVEPGGFKARLTLADGTTIVLDSAAAGELARQGNTLVMNKAGQLVYDVQEGGEGEILYNTLHTAKGEMYTTVLADGSKVWLNAASSIKFPVAFSGNERRVEITGEAYFEIAHNPSKPFKVIKGDVEVAVLGTHFNVNAYDDESEIKVTLLEGKVQVENTNSKHPNSKFLLPGQQAILSKVEGNQSTLQLINPDLEQVMAWKNGRFIFKSMDIKSLMKELERWYDIEVSYENIPATGFNARITRNTPLSSILKALELTGEVKFRIEGRKVVVMR